MKLQVDGYMLRRNIMLLCADRTAVYRNQQRCASFWKDSPTAGSSKYSGPSWVQYNRKFLIAAARNWTWRTSYHPENGVGDAFAFRPIPTSCTPSICNSCSVSSYSWNGRTWSCCNLFHQHWYHEGHWSLQKSIWCSSWPIAQVGFFLCFSSLPFTFGSTSFDSGQIAFDF